MDINLRIKELRLSNGLTQKEFSNIIKVDSSQFSKIELGKLSPTVVQLMEISSYFKVTIDWLCFGEKDNFTTNSEVKFQYLHDNVEPESNFDEIIKLLRSSLKDKDMIIEGLEFKINTLEKVQDKSNRSATPVGR